MKIGGGGGAVVVAVKRAEGRGSQGAVQWAVENLMPDAECLLLVHVMPTITSVPTPSGGSIPMKELDVSVVQMYINDMKAKCEENFLIFKFQFGADKEIMHNPHIAADGFTYGQEAIEAWLYRHDISPKTKQRL